MKRIHQKLGTMPDVLREMQLRLLGLILPGFSFVLPEAAPYLLAME